MADGKHFVNISFNSIRVNSLGSTSGIFTGGNLQYLWISDATVQTGFGTVRGEGNNLESPFNLVTDPGSSSEMLDYLEELISSNFGKWGI